MRQNRKKGIASSSNNTEEDGNHTEATQHGPSEIPPNTGAKKEMEYMNLME